MALGVLLTPPIIAFQGNDGKPAVNGTILFQVGGVNTSVYQDSGLTTPLPNPVPLNSRGEISTSNGVSVQCFLTPNTVYTATLFDASGNQLWSATYVDGIQVNITQASLGAIFYPPVGAEGATVVNAYYPYGYIDRYGTNTTPGTTDMSTAFQNACAANQLVTLQPNTTYLVAGATITNPVVVQGAGFDSVLLDKTTTLAHGTYSQTMVTATTSIDYITFRDLTIDGGCAGPASSLDSSEFPIIKITAANKVRFERVKLTRYCGAWSGTVKAVSASFWEAIVVQNAAKTEFLNCFFTQNHYEMVLIWNAPGSNNIVIIDGCSEINTGTPDSHTAFDINGGHVTVTNCSWVNTGSTSQLAVQVAQSVRVSNCTFLSMQPAASAQCNIGQDTFPYNSDVLIENNYFQNSNSAAIALGQGSSQVVRGNVIDTPANYGIKVTAGVTNFATFLTEYPEWPAPSASGSNSIVITDNVINGVSNASNISTAIFFHTVNPNAGYWFKDVQIRGNTVTSGGTPNNTFYGIKVDDYQDLTIKDNWFGYTQNGIYFETLGTNALVDGNSFVSSQSLSAISAITQATSAVITSSSTSATNPFAVNNQLIIEGVGGMTQINGLVGVVSAVSGASGAWTATTNINSSAFSAYSSGGTAGVPYVGNDIVFVGAFTSTNVKIRNNRYPNWPVGGVPSVNVFAGTIVGLEVIDNVNIHPTQPVGGPAQTAYVNYQVKPGYRTTTGAPSANGDFGLYDRVQNVPTSAQPIEYINVTPGSIGSALTCTANGTAGQNFFTCSAIGQLHVGQHFTVAGAGPASGNLNCTCVSIVPNGNVFFVDQIISTTVSGATMTLIAPAFVKSANYT